MLISTTLKIQINNSLKKHIILLALLLIAFSLDFLRDYIFVNINYQIHYLNYLDFNYTDSFIEKFISNYSINELSNIKWMLSFFFILMFAAISFLLIHYKYKKQQKKFQLLTAAFFVFILIFIGISYFTSITLTDISLQNSFYNISIEMSHYLQSSLSFISLFMIFELYQRFNTLPTQ